jgi:hypothetical protein
MMVTIFHSHGDLNQFSQSHALKSPEIPIASSTFPYLVQGTSRCPAATPGDIFRYGL